ncbi:hypothetical protein AGIG_G4570 [Arapaima gigas]
MQRPDQEERDAVYCWKRLLAAPEVTMRLSCGPRVLMPAANLQWRQNCRYVGGEQECEQSSSQSSVLPTTELLMLLEKKIPQGTPLSRKVRKKPYFNIL